MLRASGAFARVASIPVRLIGCWHMSSLVVTSPLLLAGALVLNILVLIRANRGCSPKRCITRQHKKGAYETREPIRGSNLGSLSSGGVMLRSLIGCALLAVGFALLSCAKRSEN